MEETMKEKTILIADDEEMNRVILKQIFEEQFYVLEAADGEEAVQIIDEKHDEIAIVFLDLVMPKRTGLQVMAHMKHRGYMAWIPVLMITGAATVETDIKAYEYGASDVIYKPFEAAVVMRRALNILELFETRSNLEKKLTERTRELMETQDRLAKNNEFLINALSSVVEFRSQESGQHIKRVKYFTRILLHYLENYYPELELTKEQIDQIVNASALHDIGKIAIPDSILLKPGKLTPEEFEVMKTHTTEGCKILENFKQDETDFYRYCYDICRYHHERYDGNGYPDGLAGEDIPIWAQVVSIVDVFDALVSKRVYKMPYPTGESVRMIQDGECGEFSPRLMDCFNLAKEDLCQIAEAIPYTDTDGQHSSI